MALNQATIIKVILGVVSVSGLSVGGYYGSQALKKGKVVSKDTTIKDLLVAEGYTLFEMTDVTEWKTKFNTFRQGTNQPQLAKVLKEGRGNFEVSKDKENDRGGQALKEWCEGIFKLKKEEATGNKTLDNAKLFCAEKKSSD